MGEGALTSCRQRQNKGGGGGIYLYKHLLCRHSTQRLAR